MLSLVSKTPAFRTQIHQFSIALICSRNQVKRKVTHHWIESKYSNFINRNVTIYRSYNTTRNNRYQLRPLMDIPLHTNASLFTWIKAEWLSYIIRYTVDRGFNLTEYIKGSKHAIMIVSRALAAQNYEALDGLVKDKTLDILKQNVDRLPQSERELIAVDDKCMMFNVPIDLKVNTNKTIDNDEKTVEISHVVYYIKKYDVLEDCEGPRDFFNYSMTHLSQAKYFICNYTFERTYKNGVGGAWVATVVNHFTPNKGTSEDS